MYLSSSPLFLSSLFHSPFSPPSTQTDQMSPNLLFPSLFLSSLIGITLSLADPDVQMNCYPTSCGNVTNIRYPFWIHGRQPDYCGFPQFQLNCTDKGILALEGFSDEYQVSDIFYDNQSFIVVDAKLAANQCPLPATNFFSLTPFSVSSKNKELYVLFNCSHGHPDNYSRIPCIGDVTFAYIAGGFKTQDTEVPNLPKACGSAVVPVLDTRGLLTTGFLLDWTVASCAECLESKGQCGYNNETESFMCICPDRIHYKSCKSKSDKGKKIIAIASAAGAGLIAVFFLGLFLYKRKRRQQHSASSTLLYRSTSSELSSKKDPELGNISGIDYQTHIFSYDELHEATNGFDASKELGDGGFGTVYKGKLRDGRIVAVKRLYESNYKRVEQFMNEVVILSRLRHQNLVTLYGCTSRHSRELLLVYEFVPKGTVADHLHGSRTSEGGLTWPVRMSIAIETADALAYLHAVEPPIIHRDVKTNNILLDNSFHVKVADFGLSRLFPLDATHVSTAPQGTPGYVDPEYHQCYQLTDKSDVYSFGVVLMELISSMPAVDITRHRHEINLATMAMNKIQNQELDKFVDHELGYHSDVEVKRMITQVAELAFRCLQMDREMRPNVKEVLEELRGIEIGDAPKPEKLGDADIPTKEESRLLKNFPPYSPDSVADRWGSMSTTPNTSG